MYKHANTEQTIYSRRMQIGSLILITFTVRCQSGENGGNLQV